MNATTDERSWKRDISQSFDRAARHYHQEAHLQRQVACNLFRRLSQLTLPSTDPCILEIGCGTGFLTELLAQHWPGATIVATDISVAMLRHCRERLPANRHRFVCMDGEAPALTSGSFDLICSSLATQWFWDFPGAVAKLVGMLAPAGHLAYATLAERTFWQWREALRRAGLPSRTRDYPSVRSLADMWPSPGHGEIHSEQLLRWHATPLAFLNELRRLGASTPAPRGQPAAGASLRRVLRQLDRPDGFHVTYHVAYGIYARNRS